jgi:hypothetical protein
VRSWGIRPKLVAVVLVPIIAALVLGGIRLQSSLTTSTSYSRLGSLADLLPRGDSLSSALQAERTATAGSLATPAAAVTEAATLASARTATDSAVATFRSAIPGVDTSHNQALQQRLAANLASLATLPALRAATDAGGAGTATVVDGYGGIVAQLSGLTDSLTSQQADASVTSQVAIVRALADAKEADANRQAIVYAAALRGSLTSDDLSDLVIDQTTRSIALNTYLSSLSGPDRSAYDTTAGAAAINTADTIGNRVVSVQSIANLGVSPAQWLTASGAAITEFGRLQTEKTATLDSYINSLGRSASTDALVGAAIIYVIIGLALLATLLLARSILRPLRLLRAGALEVAYAQLPTTVRRLQDDAPPDGVLEVAPIGVSSTDEIGQVARAFDAVHSEAVLLAGQQALMRNNVNKMFINLSRRSQSLVERQLRLIDELEASEQDADQLANLFKLDHLATRMRRNDENLLVLAGDDGARRRSDPVPMLDVLRAASGEVEQYNRVQLDAQSDFDLTGTAVNDVVHLVAELVENATTFSSPSTLVWVRSHSLGVGGEMLIEVEDHGIGMGPAELSAANEKLAAPLGLDISMSRLMGLFVVGRLARRHRIDVQLRPSSYGGVTAFVRLPADLITTPKVEIPEPVAVAAVAAMASNETSPIFEALQSEWFIPRSPADSPASNGVQAMPAAVESLPAGSLPITPLPTTALPGAPLPVTALPVTALPNWTSPGDEGWRVAATLGAPERASAEVTSSGLPVRVPGRNLIPGSADPAPDDTGSGAPVITAPAPSPRLSAGLSSYQRGINRGRTNDHTEDGEVHE